MRTIGYTELSNYRKGNFFSVGKWLSSNLTLHISGNNFDGFNAKCHLCYARFNFNRGTSVFRRKQVVCPACGAVHNIDNIMYSPHQANPMPFDIEIKIIEFKEKVEMRLKYFSNELNSFYLCRNKEIFTFDIKNRKTIWKKTAKGYNTNIDKTVNISYFTEAFPIMEKESIIYLMRNSFYTIGDNLKTLLNKLYKIINKLLKNKGYKEQKFYIRGDKFYNFGGNILNLAHRIKFIDCPNVDKLAKINCMSWLLKLSLNDEWERAVYALQEKTQKPYLDCALKYFGLPVKPLIKKLFSLENIENLKLAFFNFPYDEAETALKIFQKITSYENDKKELFVKAYKTIKHIYPKLKVKELWENKFWADTYLMLHGAENKILKRMYLQKIPFGCLHDFLATEIRNSSYRRQFFDIPKDIINRMEMQLNFYSTKVINFHKQLVYASETLNNCAVSYNNRISKNLQLVTIADDNGKLLALLEIKDWNLVQAKLCNNKPVAHNAEILKTVLDFSEKCGLTIKTQDVFLPNDISNLQTIAIA